MEALRWDVLVKLRQQQEAQAIAMLAVERRQYREAELVVAQHTRAVYEREAQRSRRGEHWLREAQAHGTSAGALLQAQQDDVMLKRRIAQALRALEAARQVRRAQERQLAQALSTWRSAQARRLAAEHAQAEASRHLLRRRQVREEERAEEAARVQWWQRHLRRTAGLPAQAASEAAP